MKTISLKIQPKRTHIKMSDEELQRYLQQTRKSGHIFRNKKKFIKSRDRQKKFDY